MFAGALNCIKYVMHMLRKHADCSYVFSTVKQPLCSLLHQTRNMTKSKLEHIASLCWSDMHMYKISRLGSALYMRLFWMQTGASWWRQ